MRLEDEQPDLSGNRGGGRIFAGSSNDDLSIRRSRSVMVSRFMYLHRKKRKREIIPMPAVKYI